MPELGGSRPDRLYEVRPQERVQRHAVEQFGDSAPLLPSLDVPVPLLGEQLVEVYKLLDVAVPKQVIEVPKIFVDDIPSRLSIRVPQMVDQLVTVPSNPDTVLCVLTRSSAPRIEDQLVEVPQIVPPLVPFFAVRLAAALWTHGGLLVEGGLLPHPVGPPTEVYRQGGIEILAAATLADVAVVDVPVNMQHKFQQSLVLQFINRVEVIPVAT